MHNLNMFLFKKYLLEKIGIKKKSNKEDRKSYRIM